MQSEWEKIGARLVHLRTVLNLKPAEICRLTGIQPPQWTRFESGDRRISLDSALVLKAKFGVTLDYIYTGDATGLPLSLAKALAAQPPQAPAGRQTPHGNH